MNTKVVVSVFVVASSGVFKAMINHAPVTPIILGSYIFLLVLAVMDVFGGQMSTLAGALALIAATFVLLTEFPWTQLVGIVQGKGSVKEATLPNSGQNIINQSRGPGQT